MGETNRIVVICSDLERVQNACTFSRLFNSHQSYFYMSNDFFVTKKYFIAQSKHEIQTMYKSAYFRFIVQLNMAFGITILFSNSGFYRKWFSKICCGYHNIKKNQTDRRLLYFHLKVKMVKTLDSKFSNKYWSRLWGARCGELNGMSTGQDCGLYGVESRME